MKNPYTGKRHGGHGHGTVIRGANVKRHKTVCTEEERAWIIDRAAKHPDHPYPAIGRIFFRTFGRDISPETVRRIVLHADSTLLSTTEES